MKQLLALGLAALILTACSGGDAMGDADEAAISNSAKALEAEANATVNQQIRAIESEANAAN